MQENDIACLAFPKTSHLLFAQKALPQNQEDQFAFLLKHQGSISCFKSLSETCPITRKIEFLTGRILLKDAIKTILNDEIVDTEVGIGSSGMPLWPGGIIGSVTHTKRHVCVMVGLSQEYLAMGIDLEPLISSEKSQELGPLVLGASEIDLYRQDLSAMPFNQFFTRCYSFKEAIYKLLFPQIKTFIDFKEIVITHIDPYQDTILAIYRPLIANQFSGHFLEGKSFNYKQGIFSYILLSKTR